MIWFSEDVVATEMLFDNYISRLQNLSLSSDAKTSVDDILSSMTSRKADVMQASMAPGVNAMEQSVAFTTSTQSMFTSVNTNVVGNNQNQRNNHIQNICATVLSDYFTPDGLVPQSLNFALEDVEHIMEVTKQRLLLAFFSMMNYSVRQLINYHYLHEDFPLTEDSIQTYITRAMLVNIVWSLTGDGKWKCRQDLCNFIRGRTTITLPPNEQQPIIDYEVVIEGGEVQWAPWSRKVPRTSIDASKIAAGDVVVPTMDTVRHELLLNTWLSERKPLVLCGPPGSGKTMTLLSALR